MYSTYSPSILKQFFLLLLQLLTIVICLGYINFIYYKNILPDRRVAEDYSVTNCIIGQKMVVTQGSSIARYRADFFVSFISPEGQRIQTSTSGNGLDRSFSLDKQSQDDLLEQFSLGESYPCWYNPQDFKEVVLVQRHSWSSSFPLIVPSLIGLSTLFYFIKNLYLIVNLIILRVREK